MNVRVNLKSCLVMAMFLIAMGGGAAAVGQIIYVDADATGANDGSSWEDAYRYLQDALADSRVSFRPLEIHVAQGVHRPDLGAGVTEGDRGASFVLVGGVVVRGGYAGLGAAQPDRRDIEMYESVLSGDLAGDDGAGFANYGENSYHVVSGWSSWEPLDRIAIDGFTITGGNADGEDWENKHGGGISIGDCEATISNCTIISNRAARSGGGMHGSGSGGCGSTINNCRFIGNSSGVNGGGLALDGESGGYMNNCLFAGNFSACGGAFYDIESYPDMTNCTFACNRASIECGGAREYEGGLNFRNCILWGNTDASGSGESAQVISYYWYHPPIEYCCIQGWTGTLGGAGNIDADPCFADLGYWDANGTPEDVNDDVWVNGDYHLKSQAGRWDPNSGSWVNDDVTSLCIDAGDPGSPIGYEPFPNGGIINMGAYGGTSKASKSYFGEPICETIVAGDINGDCIINFLDFSLMAYHWLEDNNP